MIECGAVTRSVQGPLLTSSLSLPIAILMRATTTGDRTAWPAVLRKMFNRHSPDGSDPEVLITLARPSIEVIPMRRIEADTLSTALGSRIFACVKKVSSDELGVNSHTGSRIFFPFLSFSVTHPSGDTR